MSGMPNGGVGSQAPAKPLFKQIDPEIRTIQASKGTEQRRPVLSVLKQEGFGWYEELKRRTMAGTDSAHQREVRDVGEEMSLGMACRPKARVVEA